VLLSDDWGFLGRCDRAGSLESREGVLFVDDFCDWCSCRCCCCCCCCNGVSSSDSDSNSDSDPDSSLLELGGKVEAGASVEEERSDGCLWEFLSLASVARRRASSSTSSNFCVQRACCLRLRLSRSCFGAMEGLDARERERERERERGVRRGGGSRGRLTSRPRIGRDHLAPVSA
jgi:hypothetical protein